MCQEHFLSGIGLLKVYENIYLFSYTNRIKQLGRASSVRCITKIGGKGAREEKTKH